MFRILLILYIVGCGGGQETYEKSPSPVAPGGNDNQGGLSSLAIASIQKNCATCHGGSQAPALTNEAQIKASLARVCVRTGNGTMPPGGNISQSDKDAILGECK